MDKSKIKKLVYSYAYHTLYKAMIPDLFEGLTKEECKSFIQYWGKIMGVLQERGDGLNCWCDHLNSVHKLEAVNSFKSVREDN